MKKFVSMVAALALACICLLGFAGCQTDDGKEKLIVYTEAGFAPWEFTTKGSTEIIGIDMEIAKYIAEKFDYDLEVIDGSFDAIVAGISEDNALGIAGISWDAERDKAVEFSDFYWGDAFQTVVYLKDSAPELVDGAFAAANFAGKKLVFQTGTTSQLTVEANKDDWQIDGTADFAEVLAALEDMKSSENTYLIVDSQVAAQLVAANPTCAYAPIENLDAESYGIVAKKGNTALIEKVNEALAELLAEGADGKSQIDKWFDEYSAIEADE